MRRPVPDDLFGGRLRGAQLLDLEVTAVENLASHVRCITVASPDLLGFEYDPGQDLMIGFPDGPRVVRRRYTIRRANPVTGTADLEFELHRGGGVAAHWAATAEVGAHLEAIGPRGAITLRLDVDHHLFVADDSAMPTAFSMLEALPSSASATAVLVTPHPGACRPGAASAAEVTTHCADEPRLTDVLAGIAVGGNDVAYVFGERRLVIGAARVLAEKGLDRQTIMSKAYWRSDQPNAAHGEPLRD